MQQDEMTSVAGAAERQPEHGQPPQQREPGLGRALSRRQLLVGAAGVAGVGGVAVALSPIGHKIYHHLRSSLVPTTPPEPPIGTPTRGAIGALAPGWTLSPASPILDIDPTSPWISGAVYDCCVLRRADGSLWMWYTTRGPKPDSITLAIDTTGDGDHFVTVPGDPGLQPAPPESVPYGAITRPSVLPLPGGGYRLWYSVVGNDHAWIGTATSPDGKTWTKHGSPLLTPTYGWEKEGVCCPNVIFDGEVGRYLMWYSGGPTYEPEAVGFATSPDGVTWTKYSSEPIFAKGNGWDNGQIGSFQVRRVGGWYYAFYNGFQKAPFISRIGMARSRDGVTNWERHPNNPILAPGPRGSWDGAMIYKPTALWDERRGRWDVWFNASAILNEHERIGHMWSAGIW